MIIQQINSTLETGDYTCPEALALGEDLSMISDLFIVKDLEGKFRLSNNMTSEALGFKDCREMLNLEITDHSMRCGASELANLFDYQDAFAMSNKKRVKNVAIAYFNGGYKVLLGHKTPILNSKSECTGLLTASFDATSATSVLPWIMLAKKDKETEFGEQYTYLIAEDEDYCVNDRLEKFTKKQALCSFLLMRGKTAKEIASIMSISKRTAEAYINAIKEKLDCSSKSDIIDRMIEVGAHRVIPQSAIEHLVHL